MTTGYGRNAAANGALLIERMRGIGCMDIPLRGTGKPIIGFAGVCTGSCTCPAACADLIRFPSTKKDRPQWACLFLERMRGIEPPLSAWEAGVLPMNYIRMQEQYSTAGENNQSLFRRFFSPPFAAGLRYAAWACGRADGGLRGAQGPPDAPRIAPRRTYAQIAQMALDFSADFHYI